MKDIENSVKRIIAFYSKKGIEVKEIWYEADVRVGVVIRYSVDGVIKEKKIPMNKDIEEIIAPYKNKKGIVIKIEVEAEIKITEVLPALNISNW